MVVAEDVGIELYGRVALAPGSRTPFGPTLPMARKSCIETKKNARILWRC
jgi:hypothetical protein